MPPADSHQRSKLEIVLKDIGRWFFGESLLLWALADSAEANGHHILSQFFWFILWISAVAVFLVKLYPLVERIGPLALLWIIASGVIAYYWFQGSTMPHLLAGKLRFVLPITATVFVIYLWYRSLWPSVTKPSAQPATTSPATAPATQAATNPRIGETAKLYVELLDRLERATNQMIHNKRFLKARYPELDLTLPLKPEATGVSQEHFFAREAARRANLKPDEWKIIQDPEIHNALMQCQRIDATLTEIHRHIIETGKALASSISSIAEPEKLDPFLELEHAITSDKHHESLTPLIAAARKQARHLQLQHESNDNSAPSNELLRLSETEKVRDRFRELKESIERLHQIKAGDSQKEDQLRRLQLQVMNLYFDAVAKGFIQVVLMPKTGQATLQDWKNLAESIESPLVPHPEVVGAARIGSAYTNPPIGITAWIDHAIAVVNYLWNRIVSEADVRLVKVQNMLDVFDQWAVFFTNYERMGNAFSEGSKLRMNDLLLWIRENATPLISLAEGYGIDAARLRSFCKTPGEETNPARRNEIRAVLDKLDGAILKQRHSA